MSAAWMVLKSSSERPWPSTLTRWGWKRISGASKRSPAESNDAPVGQSPGLDEDCGLQGESLLGGDVVSDVAERLLHLPDGVEVGGVVEGVAPEEEEFDEVLCDVAAGDVESTSEMVESESLVDGADVCDSVARVDDDAGE